MKTKSERKIENNGKWETAIDEDTSHLFILFFFITPTIILKL